MATHYKYLTIGLLASLFVASMSSARAEVDALVRQARVMLEQGQAQQAFDLLEPQETPRAGDPDFDTVLGIAAIETGQFTRAVFALERVLSVQPENSRARAELGRALFAAGDTRASRKVLLEAKRDNIPQGAADSIDQFLQAIDRIEEAARSSVKPYLDATVGYDTNINSGPGNPNVAVPIFGGAVFTLTPSAIETKAAFITLGGGVSGRYVLDPRWSLIGNVSGNTRGNAGHGEFNTSQVDLNAGTVYRYEKHEFSGVAQVGTYSLNGTRARDQAGLVGEWTYRPDGFHQWNSYVQWGRLSYPAQQIRDADRAVFGTNYAYAFRDGLLVFAGAYIGSEKERASAVPHLGHKLLGVRVGAQKSVADTFALFASLGFENRNYGGPDPLFLVMRRDRQVNVNLGFNWVPASYWRITPQLALSSVKSNVATSDFNKSSLSVTIRRDF